MSRVAYVNGAFVPRNHARVFLDDRGYHFADGVYEVIAYNHHKVFVDVIPHLDRLRNSLKVLEIPFSLSDQGLLIIMHELVRKNRYPTGYIYLQITRGVAPRNHVTPNVLDPVLTMFVNQSTFRMNASPLKVFTTKDIRWKRNDIKSISLLGAVLAKREAFFKEGDEAWLVDDQGFVTEGGATNAWIINQLGILQTHPATSAILNGIVRQRILKIAKRLQIPFEEKAFTVDEALRAQEAFLTTSTKGVHTIAEIDGHIIGGGRMGSVTHRLQEAYWKFQHHLTSDYDDEV